MRKHHRPQASYITSVQGRGNQGLQGGQFCIGTGVRDIGFVSRELDLISEELAPRVGSVRAKFPLSARDHSARHIQAFKLLKVLRKPGLLGSKTASQAGRGGKGRSHLEASQLKVVVVFSPPGPDHGERVSALHSKLRSRVSQNR